MQRKMRVVLKDKRDGQTGFRPIKATITIIVNGQDILLGLLSPGALCSPFNRAIQPSAYRGI